MEMTKKNIVFAITAIVLAVFSYVNGAIDIVPSATVVQMPYNVILLVAGFYMLIKGADVFVEAASKIATKFNIPQMVIGLTIVAFGTSLPEAAVSIKGAFSGNSGITVGNVVGSNIMNILLILGVSSCIAALPIKKNTFRIEIPFVIFTTVLLLVLGKLGEEISRIDGAIFLFLMALFMVYLIYSAKKGGNEDEQTEVSASDTMLKLIILVIIGATCIVVGSDVTVDAASFIAAKCGMDDRLIGLTVVAFGTSLPELMTSSTAARKGKVDIAIGNIVGSNIFNIIFVVGICAVICPVTFKIAFVKDTIVAIAAAVLLFLCVIKNKKLTRAGGVIMLCSYACYFAYILYSNYC